MEQNQLLENLGETYGYLQAYVEKRVELARLEITEKYAHSLSVMVTLLLLIALGGFVLFLLTLALGIYLGGILNSYSLSFLILAGVYAFFALMLVAFRNPLIRNRIFAAALDSLDDERS